MHSQKNRDVEEAHDDHSFAGAPRVDESEIEEDERAREEHDDDDDDDDLAEEIRVDDLSAMEGPDVP